jgi:fructose/tagatose bisphosphate aldolase
MASHSIVPGVATGDAVQAIFALAKQKSFALPAVNVTGSNTINSVLETAATLNAPVIIQFSNTFINSLRHTVLPLSFIPTTVRKTYCLGSTDCSMQAKSTLKHTESLYFLHI